MVLKSEAKIIVAAADAHTAEVAVEWTANIKSPQTGVT